VVQKSADEHELKQSSTQVYFRTNIYLLRKSLTRPFFRTAELFLIAEVRFLETADVTSAGIFWHDRSNTQILHERIELTVGQYRELNRRESGTLTPPG
jgi:hypothetical protein